MPRLIDTLKVGDVVEKISRDVDTQIPLGTLGKIVDVQPSLVFVIWAQEAVSLVYPHSKPTDPLAIDNVLRRVNSIGNSEWESEIEFA